MGGKFLIVPPGYNKDESTESESFPDGYDHVARSATRGHWVVWRGFQVDGSTSPAVDTTKKLFRMYPLSQRDDPPKMTFVNMSGKLNNTVHRMDY
eukprot:1265247-Pyramimonas_sp.AAC.1